jgi:V8-like Glu-specific endopeptidase
MNLLKHRDGWKIVGALLFGLSLAAMLPVVAANGTNIPGDEEGDEDQPLNVQSIDVGILSNVEEGQADQLIEKALKGQARNITESIRSLSLPLREHIGVPSQTQEATQLGVSTLIRTDSLLDRGQPQEEFDPAEEISEDIRLEQVIDDPNFLPVSFIVRAAQVQSSVGRIAFRFAGIHQSVGGIGTGTLIGDNWMLTNNHVIPNEQSASSRVFQLNFQYDSEGVFGPVTTLDFEPAERDGVPGFFTNEQLDYTLIRVKDLNGAPPSEVFGHLSLPSVVDDSTFPTGIRVNIIQHPTGRAKEVVVHNNTITKRFSQFVRYTADTLDGSSGSPVFNDLFQLIALHHSVGTFDPTLNLYRDNEGVRIDAIVQHLQTTAPPSVLSDVGVSITP